MAIQLEKDFIKGANQTNNIPYEVGKEMWTNVIESFGKYGFNKTMHKDTLIMTSKGIKK